MARSTYVRNTNTTNRQRISAGPRLRTGLFAGAAAFVGMAVGFVAALAVVLPAIHTEFAAQTKQLSDRLVALTPAPAALSSACAQSAPLAPSAGHVLGAAATAVPAVAPAAAPTAPAPAPGNTFVTKLVGGTFAHTAASIADTGPSSTNTITTTNSTDTTITNTTSVAAVSTAVQNAQSGDVHSTQNTTAGTAASGPATNTNSVLALLTVHN